MLSKKTLFVCPYGKFPNRHAAAKVAEKMGLSNAFVKLANLCKTDPMNYFYEKISLCEVPKKFTSNHKAIQNAKNNQLTKVHLKDGSEVSWEEFSKWSDVRQRSNLIPISDETRHKQRNAALNKWNNKKYRSEMSQAHIGNLHSEETKQLLRKLKGTAVVTPNGEFPSIRAAAESYKVSDTTMRKWLWKNKTEHFYVKND